MSRHAVAEAINRRTI